MGLPIMVRNMRFVKLSKKNIQEINSYLKSIMSNAHEGVFYRTGKVIGKDLLDLVDEADNDRLKMIIKARGWVDEIDLENETATVKGSIEVNKEEDSPTCHMLRGIICGIQPDEPGVMVEVEEKKCESMGDDHCEFKIIKEKY